MCRCRILSRQTRAAFGVVCLTLHRVPRAGVCAGLVKVCALSPDNSVELGCEFFLACGSLLEVKHGRAIGPAKFGANLEIEITLSFALTAILYRVVEDCQCEIQAKPEHCQVGEYADTAMNP